MHSSATYDRSSGRLLARRARDRRIQGPAGEGPRAARGHSRGRRCHGTARATRSGAKSGEEGLSRPSAVYGSRGEAGRRRDRALEFLGLDRRAICHASSGGGLKESKKGPSVASWLYGSEPGQTDPRSHWFESRGGAGSLSATGVRGSWTFVPTTSLW
jgi:hypothetical protein